VVRAVKLSRHVIAKGHHRVENPTRRRLLAAGFAGTTLGLLGSRAVSASPDTSTPPTDEGSTSPAAGATAPSPTPTEDDIPKLQFAHALEIAARDLYQAAFDAGVQDDTLASLQTNHQAYADVLHGLLGTDGGQRADEGVVRRFRSRFASGDVGRVVDAAYDLESAAVATHTALIGELQGIDGAHLLASIAVVEARHVAVLADMAGRGDDVDAMFRNDAEPLSAGTSQGA
jgi:hypothetical protein